MKKGPLIKVDLGNGRFVKKYQADAIAEGLIEAPASTGSASGQKGRPAGKDKARPAGKDKGRPGGKDKEDALAGEENKSQEDFRFQVEADFTVIEGVGPATARALAAQGITTYEALRAAGPLDFLNAPTNAAIQAWREASDG